MLRLQTRLMVWRSVRHTTSVVGVSIPTVPRRVVCLPERCLVRHNTNTGERETMQTKTAAEKRLHSNRFNNANRILKEVERNEEEGDSYHGFEEPETYQTVRVRIWA